jgi:DTW domain-containing protein
MSQRRAGYINRCPDCRVNHHVCVCAHILPRIINSNVSLIVHVRELKLTSNTAQFVKKMLPQNTEICIRGSVNGVFDASPIMLRSGRPLFLYPHEDALELNHTFTQNFPGPYHLIVPDGNWHQARRVRRREDAFRDMMAVKLPEGVLGEYKLRKAPQPSWVSTYESVAHALGVLEGVEVREHLMDFFRHWVNTTLFCRTQDKAYLG